MPSALVIGAGVFGASLADRLAREGWEVTLVDRFEPGHARAESGGETRLIRCSHGPEDFYARSARRALELWRELGEGVLVESGVAWFARREDGWEADSERVLRAAGIPVERLSPEAGARLLEAEARPTGTAGKVGDRILEADAVIWACGAWLGRLFPGLVPLRVTFQQLVLFEAPLGWTGPGWVDFDAAFY